MTNKSPLTIDQWLVAKGQRLTRSGSKLDPFKEQILSAIERGITYEEIRNWLRDEHDLIVSRSNINAWYLRRKRRADKSVVTEQAETPPNKEPISKPAPIQTQATPSAKAEPEKETPNNQQNRLDQLSAKIDAKARKNLV